jgi:hypothetical protein
MQLAHYYGIDLSAAALELANKALESLGCPAAVLELQYASGF